MNERLRARVESLIECAEDQSGRITENTPAGGGCINEACVVRMDDGRRYFVKSNAAPLPRLFECEAEGLAALSETRTLRIPRPLGAAEPTGPEDRGGPAPGFIVMEYIQPGRPGRDFMQQFGRALAELHRSSSRDYFGFAHDNYIGSTPQPNGKLHDWVEFWRACRLGYQLALARERGLADAAMIKLGDRLLDRLEEMLTDPAETPCLLHGDLWGGNYLADSSGKPVLIDPAVYYGRREADLAMTYLFGGFNADFYAAYEEVWPLAKGSPERIEIYKLYHLLNHLNLFGPGYYAGCMAILRKFK